MVPPQLRPLWLMIMVADDASTVDASMADDASTELMLLWLKIPPLRLIMGSL
jgi:hypothetical protein